MVCWAVGRVMTTPGEAMRFTVSRMHALPVDGPQSTVFTVPKVNGAPTLAGVSVGGVDEDSPNVFAEYASGQPGNGFGGVQLPASPPTIKAVPKNVVPLLKIPSALKHSCPPQSAEVDDKSTCTSCACAGAANDRTSQAAASNRKGRAKEFFLVVIPLPSIDVPFNDACARNSQGSMPSQTAIPLESYPARNPEVSRVVVLVWTNRAEA